MTHQTVIVTDICKKANQKIIYEGNSDDLQTPVTIRRTNISSWNVFHQAKLLMKSIFLPRGYPGSVSQDYLEYQIWDTCQAFCSSISGTLAMRAVMHGIGVGSETATPASAAIMWIMKDGTGMVGSILFAWLKGSKLDSECKKWRFFADILNDIALFTEIYVPFYLEYSLCILCVSTLFKALVGTAGSSTRAALITHQAIKDNIADVSAKDGSQEIFVNLCAFILGVILLNRVTETEEVWTIMCTATFFHLLFNYKAVKCLRMKTFNNERFLLVLRAYLPTSFLPSIEQVNKRESVILFTGLRDTHLFGFSAEFGVSLRKAIQSQKVTVSQFSTVVGLFKNKNYIIVPHIKRKKFYVALRESFQPKDILMAYFHACLLGICITYLENKKTLKIMLRTRKNSPLYRLKNILEHSNESGQDRTGQGLLDSKLLFAYTTCKAFVEKEFSAFSLACYDEGWDIDKNLISIHDWRSDWINVAGKKEKVKVNTPDRRKFQDTSKRPKENNVREQNNVNQRKTNYLVIS